MYNEQFSTQKKSAQYQYKQLSIFDLLPPKDWGDARPEDYLPQMPDNQYEIEQRTRATIKRITDKIKKAAEEAAEESDIERTCVWCGLVIEGPLDEHEDGCAS